MADLKLSACPFCGGQKLEFRAIGPYSEEVPDEPGQIVCSNSECAGAAGPIRYGRTLAAEAWNSRPE